MGGRKITAKSIKRKDAPTHPKSRRAHQLERVALRDVKLSSRKTERNRAVEHRVERILALLLLLPDEIPCLPDLPALHTFMEASFLTRRDAELEEEVAKRRPGRPPSKQEVELKEVIAAERREYMEQMEVPDLLHEENVKLMRQWEGDAQALGLYRFVRISGTHREQYVQTQAGRHKDLEIADAAMKKVMGGDEEMAAEA
ncbi:hypothetical protein BDZ90DRAFT_230337 [Jaminaea rosea]|uniref:Translation machinery-associated protein 16 n=1 Tax=Jaminaea rosea TaxID=1569628 RepID=A0A316UVZ3_9BASI|nr:hypothetical protein BDZ90DRAFT_230337 [Jaminaea rosea]PWN29466.1 hypothetical protein BDZ90DRAFT_230337 [Jaminaea rosea]